MAYNSNRRVRLEKKAEDFLIRVLKSFTSPSGHYIGKGSVIYYPKIVADNMVKGGWGERVYGVRSQIVS